MHELMKWVGAVPTLVGLGLALGMSPALYGATADTLARGSHIRSRLTWLLSGLVAGATVLVVVLRGLDPAHFVAQVRSRGDALVEDRMVDLTAGVMLLVAACVVAVWVWAVPDRTRPQDAASSSGEGAASGPGSDGPSPTLFLVGFGSSIIGVTTLPIMYLTGRVVAGVSPDLLLRAAAYLVFVVALVAPFIALAWLWTRFPAATRKVTAAYDRVLAWDPRITGVVIMAVGGIAMVAVGLLGHR